MRKLTLTLLAIGLALAVQATPSQACCGVAMEITSLEVHNPTGSSYPDGSEKDPKSQFSILNDSAAGIRINKVEWYFQSPIFVDSAAGGPGYGGYRDYTPQSGSDVTTGYAGPSSFTDGANSLTLTFSNFDPGETFGFWTDLDSTNNVDGRIGNKDFDGSRTVISFSDGAVADFTWDLPNNTGRSFYARCLTGIIHPVPEPATMLLFGSGILAAFARRKIVS